MSLVSGPKGIGMKANAFLALPTTSSQFSFSSESSGLEHSFENSLRLSFTSSNSAGPSSTIPTPPSPMHPSITPLIAIGASYYESHHIQAVAVEQIDYFNFKQQTYFPDTPPPTIRRLHPRPSPCLRSHFSPAITPAAAPSLTRPSSPVISSPYPPTPEEDPFPYMAYESTQPSPKQAHSPHSSTRSSSPITPELITLKVYFRSTGDMIKFKVDKHQSLADVIRTAAKRVPTGWESLYSASPDMEIQGAEDVEFGSLHRLAKDDHWRSWLDNMTAEGTTRLILWAL